MHWDFEIGCYQRGPLKNEGIQACLILVKDVIHALIAQLHVLHENARVWVLITVVEDIGDQLGNRPNMGVKC